MTTLFGLHLQEKITPAVRTSSAPKIDGRLYEKLWNSTPELTEFIQVHPYNGEVANQRTIVKTSYDDEAFYVCAMMYDAPDSIFCEIGPRDSYHNISSDLFEIQIAPFEDGAISYFFAVSASGVQSDLIYSSNGRDKNADAVWESATKITENGWTVEARIPYSALRFPKKEVQDWGINFYRTVKRTGEKSSWNFVNNEIDQWWTQTGKVENLQKIDPPLRLSFMPYISGYLEKYDNSVGNSYNGGMDMKFGINESFTLDMTLIPDFGQVQSDDQILNLSPFERHYSERRQFFTEAAELFGKANLFYSRRIGSKPMNYGSADDNLDSSEKVIDNPDKTQLINATKFSGRTSGGLGIGIFNAMTKSTYATIEDTITGKQRRFKTQNFTNYNLTVIDQAFQNNSYISIVNSNVKSGDFVADVYATEFRVFDNSQFYSIRGGGAVSNRFENDNMDRGFRYNIAAGKTNGKLQYSYRYSVLSDTFDPKDLGFLRQNNRINQSIDLSHRQRTPFGIFRSLFNEFSVYYGQQYQPQKYMNMELRYEISASFRNLSNIWVETNWNPTERNNFAEPRVNGRVFKKPKAYNFFMGYNSNRNKFYSVGIRSGFFKSYESDRNQLWSMFNLTQILKLNNRMNFKYQFRISQDLNDYGYVDDEDSDIIYFGKRDVKNLTNTIESNYMFSEKSSVNFRLRHYWSAVEYDRFFTLTEKGYLEDTDSYEENKNINFNAFTINMMYTWNFAPGSRLTLVWKNSISVKDDELVRDPLKNFRNTLDSPQLNSISLKLLYYLDYLNLKKYYNV